MVSDDPIVASVLDRWKKAMEIPDVPALMSLYDKDALFFGSRVPLYTRPDEIEEYFASVPERGVERADFSDARSVRTADDTIIVGANVDFYLNMTETPEHWVWRITLALRRNDDGEWLIVLHHTGPRDPVDATNPLAW